MLTVRETDVLVLLSRGCTYGVIGDRLGISVHTVTSHIKNAYRKLAVHTAAAAVTRAAELNLLHAGVQPGHDPVNAGSGLGRPASIRGEGVTEGDPSGARSGETAK